MYRQLIQLVFAAGLFLSGVVSCKKTDDGVTAIPALNCSGTTLSTVSFTNSNVAQSTTLTVGLSNATAGSATFTITSTGSDFSPGTYTTNIIAGQSSVAIPLTFDGSANVSSETVSVSSSYASGTCTAVATISGGTSSTTGTSGTGSVSAVVAAANAFLATLSTAQQAAVVLTYDKTNAIKWSNLPCGSQCRVGLQLSTLTSAQLTAALAVVKAATGSTTNEGYDEVLQIRMADDYLNTNGGGSGYSSGIYFISFLGTPSLTGTWQFQFGGHHLAVNNTYKNGVVQGASPHFEGVEPKTWTVNNTTYAPLNQEQAAMAALLASLSSTQLAAAKLSSTFSDVVLGPGSDGKFPGTKVGIQVSTLSTAQQALVMAAIKPWVLDADDETAASLLATYQSELANTYIACSGNTSLTNNADYVRIDGPSVWIEFVCQAGVVFRNEIHYHSIWRDHVRDYGGNFTF